MDDPKVIILVRGEKPAERVIKFLMKNFDPGADILMPDARADEVGLGGVETWHVVQLPNQKVKDEIKRKCADVLDICDLPDQILGCGHILLELNCEHLLKVPKVIHELTEECGIKIKQQSAGKVLVGRWFQLTKAHRILCKYKSVSSTQLDRAHQANENRQHASLAHSSLPVDISSGHSAHSLSAAAYTSDNTSRSRPSSKRKEDKRTNREEDTPGNELVENEKIMSAGYSGHDEGSCVNNLASVSRSVTEVEKSQSAGFDDSFSDEEPSTTGLNSHQSMREAHQKDIPNEGDGHNPSKANWASPEAATRGNRYQSEHATSELEESAYKDTLTKTGPESPDQLTPFNSQPRSKLQQDSSEEDVDPVKLKKNRPHGAHADKNTHSVQVEVVSTACWIYMKTFCITEKKKIENKFDVEVVGQMNRDGAEIYLRFSEFSKLAAAKSKIKELCQSCEHNADSIAMNNVRNIESLRKRFPAVEFEDMAAGNVIAVGRFEDILYLKKSILGGQSSIQLASQSPVDNEMKTSVVGNKDRTSNERPKYQGMSSSGDRYDYRDDTKSTTPARKDPAPGLPDTDSDDDTQAWWKTKGGPSRQVSYGGSVYNASRHGQAIFIHKDDITKMRVDVVVNATGNNLENSGGVSKAIADTGGPLLQEACRDAMRSRGPLKPGEIVKTGPGRLHCKFVIHAAGPRWKKSATPSEMTQIKKHLESTISACLYNASHDGASSIAVPAISSGVYGVPHEVVAECFLEATKDFCRKQTQLQEIHFVDISATVIQAIDKVFKTSTHFDHMNPEQKVSSSTFHSSHTSRTSAVAASPGRSSSYAGAVSGPSYGILPSIGVHGSSVHGSLDAGADAEPQVHGLAMSKDYPGRRSPASHLSSQGSYDDSTGSCAICMDKPKNKKKLPKCGHTFCSSCIEKSLKYKPVCPVCNTVYGQITGTQPRNGRMTDSIRYYQLPGYNCYTKKKKVPTATLR